LIALSATRPRRTYLAPPPPQPVRAAGPRPARPPARGHWRPTLDVGISRCRLAVVRRLASEVAAAQELCQDRIAGGTGVRRLPDELDRQLQALSIRLTNDLDARCRALLERTVTTLFGRCHPRLWRRLVAEVRAACCEEPDRVLLVTSDATVTTLYGTGSLAGLCADPDAANAPLVRPVEVAVTAGGYLLWRRRGEVPFVEAASWLRRALDSVAASLLVEVDARCDEVHRTLTRLSADRPEPRPLSFAE
jgi:hypothetical protein